jgi:hypothetical protein
MVDSSRPEARSAAPTEVSWSTWPEAVTLLVTGRTRRPALPIALIVGTLLTLFYQGGALFAGDLDAEILARITFNYCLPYIVSSIGFLLACRVPRR